MNELLKHTADLELRVLACSLSDLFKDNLGAMNDVKGKNIRGAKVLRIGL